LQNERVKKGQHMKLTPKFEEALTYATQAHAGQLRKKTQIPYIAHVLAVTAIALEHGATEEEAVAALLHDAVEDCGGAPRLAEIEARFGRSVADIVAACTDTDVTPKPPWTARKQAYVAHAAQAPAPVQLVAAADKLHNARNILSDYRDIGDEVWKRFSGGKAGSLWYYRALAEAFKSPRIQKLVAELDRVVTELERLANGGQQVMEAPEAK